MLDCTGQAILQEPSSCANSPLQPSTGLFLVGAAAPALAEHFYGGPDVDDYAGTAHSDIMTGGAGNDLLDGRGGDDYLYGGRDDDILKGGGGWDELLRRPRCRPSVRRSGQGLSAGRAGVDALVGGTGNDDFAMVARSHGDRVNCGPGLDTVGYNGHRDLTDILINCERIQLFD